MKQKIEVTVLPQSFTSAEQEQARQNIGIDLDNIITSANSALSGKLVLEDNEWVSLPEEQKYVLTSTDSSVNIIKNEGYNVTEWDISVPHPGGYKIVELNPFTQEPDVDNPSPLFIYLTKIEDTAGIDKYKEWVWNDNKLEWVLIGDTTIDLSDYYTIEETDAIIDELEQNVNQAISSINEDINNIGEDISNLSAQYNNFSEYVNTEINNINNNITNLDERVTNETSALSAFVNETKDELNNNISTVEDVLNNTISAVEQNLIETIDEVESNLEEKIAEAEQKAAEGSVLSKDIFTTTAVGYIPKGVTLTAGTKIEDILDRALSQYTKPQISVSISPSTTLYAYPNTAKITGITASITNGTVNTTGVYIINTDNLVTTAIKGFETKANVTSAINIETTAAKTFTCSASDGREIVTASKSISFCWPYFHGVSTTNTVDVSTGTKDVTNKAEKIYSYNPVGYYWIAYDSNYADLTSIKDNGGNGDETFNEWEKVSNTYAGHNYKMYITKKAKAAAGTFKFK